MYGAIEGTIFQNELTRAYGTSKSNLAQNTLHHLLTIKNGYVTNGLAGANNGNYVLNTKEAIVKSLSVSIQGQDPARIFLFFEPSSFSSTQLFYAIPRCNELQSTATGTFDIAVDTPIYEALVGINGTINVDLSAYRITVPPGSSVSVAIQSTGSMNPVTCALVWSED